MDTLSALLPSLTQSQRDALACIAREFVAAGTRAAPRARRDMLTVAQAAEQYGKSARTIYSAIEHGYLECTTPYGQSKPYYIDREDFEAWMCGTRR